VTAPGGVGTTVHLLRHGEVHNPEGILYGRLPGFHLSADGRAMAEAAARALRRYPVVHVRSSPLERAQETTAPVAAAFGLDTVLDDRLLEAGNRFEGRTFGIGDGALRHPANWPLVVNPFRPSWGEPYGEIAARMWAALTAARDAARTTGGPQAEAVCVSHQLPIWTTRRLVERRSLWHHPAVRQCGLASLTSVTFAADNPDRVLLVTYTEPAGAAARRPVQPGA